MKTFFRFFISRQFLINLGALVLFWVLLVWGFFAFIKSYGRFEQKIPVPNFIGLHIDDLEDFIKNKKVKYEIIDSVYIDDLPKGTVLSQYPEPTDSTGIYAKENRTIKLSVIPKMERLVEVPDLRSKSKAMSEILLSIIGLRAKLEFQPDEAGKDFVIDQRYNGKHLPAGTKLPKGTKITLIVSKGKGGAVEIVPDLVGLLLSEAQNKISNQALSLHDECDFCSSPEDLKIYKVIKQSPAALSEVSAGTTVMVWLGSSPLGD